ncbi:ph-response sensor protein [Vermiconidia calcicola]|uniref:Ph-response sensor protein n=1 Tax=Vermiconidia calcicola TaxID=1690605 RepID=A0ACC3N5E3_9PEZI|nr:ph-response sensor protein [Vermiconidia calcicola]
MPSGSSDHSPSTYSTPSPGRRILSRITSSFSSKARNIAEFTIEPDDPHRQYSPGDILSGHVNLWVTRPIRVTHLVICLHGFVQVYKNPGQPGESFRANPAYLGTGRGKKYGEYYGNGFASLFEDEVVLCGDGRLAEGSYQFKFELEFPDRDLPSSIDFERGTITYMISATMTRPTTMSPTITCDRKVYFVDRIDISPLYPPKPRTVTLEPISKRSRAKTQAQKLVIPSDKKSRKTDSAEQGSDPPRNSGTSSAHSTRAESETPISPVASEISLGSQMNGSQERTPNVPSQVYTSPTGSEAATTEGSISKTSLAAKVITATVESQAGGCLRGDSIPIKANVCHTKQVRSMYGVIVTLYRQARVDMRPAIPLGPTEKGKDVKWEDYYPKSATGLGGLSLSGAGSSHVFRKDLSQVMVPLVINPDTLTAEINTRVRVPEEAFPTISTVPGAMISFKYYVEVVMDVQGRLSGQDRTLGSLAGQAGIPGHHLNVESSDMERSAFTPFGSTIVDTAPIRRDKSVVTCTFEVIIGTRDSERKKGKRKTMDAVAEPQPNPEAMQQQNQQEPVERVQGAYSGVDWYLSEADHDTRWYEEQYRYDHQGHYNHIYDQPPPPLPLPDVLDESHMTEKQRIQQAETRLLPSQPPGIDDEPTGEGAAAATAPYLPDENGMGYESEPWHAAPRYPPPAAISAFHDSGLVTHEQQQLRQMPSAPEYELPPAGASTEAATSVGDDKQELQRQRLLAQASAPEANGDGNTDDAGPSVVHQPALSAPAFVEMNGSSHDVYDSHSDAAGVLALPRYER